MEHILTMLIFFPALAAILGFLVDKNSMRAFAIVVTFVEFILSVILYYNFDITSPDIQFMINIPIISSYGINYLIGIDGISLFLIIMITFMTMIAIIALTEKRDVKNLIITLLLLEMTMIGVFVSLDVILFYIFWELTIIPMFYIIGFWGYNKRLYAAVKFFLYTFAGSLIMLIGILYFGYIYYQTSGVWSFALHDWMSINLPFSTQIWLFLAFFFGFAIKMPMFPFHTWLPLAHGQAPTLGSIVLAAILLKMETYGFIRFSLGLFPDASVYFIPLLATLGIIAIIYTAMIAYAQEDMKQLIAYSSISHMGIITIGVFAINVEGISGAVFLMIGHGIVSGALFMSVGLLYDKTGTKLIKNFGGLASKMPLFTMFYLIILMASIGLPLTVGFVGEFLSLLGFFKYSPLLASIAVLTIVLSAIYMLNMYRQTFFGRLKKINMNIKDVYGRELVALGSLVILILFLGIYPKIILEPLNVSVINHLQIMESKAIKIETKDKLNELNSIKGASNE
ncbi:NADH-quinone oxidoreductase subunit M [Arcobacter vandammei]|uniref:NADH-quinone oxidoreductase subunit M n=1 Tax=Arcobacter vandammei TaxID=2782243 RepID=UPI0018DFB113|nr:NADH-quinone oxidoreductase subunit M [Arcobacter vandammei]